MGETTTMEFRLRVGDEVFVPRLEEGEENPFVLCPWCGRVLDGSWADDGEADLADWFDCSEQHGGCGAVGSFVRADDTGVTQNGIDLFLDSVESSWYGLTKGDLWLDPVRHGDEHDPELVVLARAMRAVVLQNPDETLSQRAQALRVAEALDVLLRTEMRS